MSRFLVFLTEQHELWFVRVTFGSPYQSSLTTFSSFVLEILFEFFLRKIWKRSREEIRIFRKIGDLRYHISRNFGFIFTKRTYLPTSCWPRIPTDLLNLLLLIYGAFRGGCRGMSVSNMQAPREGMPDWIANNCDEPSLDTGEGCLIMTLLCHSGILGFPR